MLNKYIKSTWHNQRTTNLFLYIYGRWFQLQKMNWSKVKEIRWDIVLYILSFGTLVILGAFQGAIWMLEFMQWLGQ